MHPIKFLWPEIVIYFYKSSIGKKCEMLLSYLVCRQKILKLLAFYLLLSLNLTLSLIYRNSRSVLWLLSSKIFDWCSSIFWMFYQAFEWFSSQQQRLSLLENDFFSSISTKLTSLKQLMIIYFWNIHIFIFLLNSVT